MPHQHRILLTFFPRTIRDRHRLPQEIKTGTLETFTNKLNKYLIKQSSTQTPLLSPFPHPQQHVICVICAKSSLSHH